jgi:hypothetical protein
MPTCSQIAVFEIHDGGDRRFQHNVGNARRIIASDQFAAIDLDLQVKTMVAQQNRRWRARKIAEEWNRRWLIGEVILRPCE